VTDVGRSAVGLRATPPQYDPTTVARLILEEAAELYPRHLTAHELSRRIIVDPDDSREVETATNAIRSLRQSGLLSYGDEDEVVVPTPAALCVFELFGG
jgi:hypothetical protein